MIRRARLFVETLSYWICATGATRGRLFDAVTVRDDDDLPMVPGRHLRGLLRDAVTRLPDDSGAAHTLFGPRDETGLAYGSQLAISSARIVAPLRGLLLARDRDEREAALFATMQSTAIDEATGSALAHTLRSYEVAVPLLLEAEIASDGAPFGPDGAPVAPISDWFDIVRRAAPLVTAVGAHRTRGYGRAVLSIEAFEAERAA